ncbi:putative gentisate 1,2-dioxygenase [Lepidopterella palustris CBS 459.81]|uniref:Putative gentisate 1,2-dioxygenase n=1 Tax=Lepidopterella palustris CBS 459.81 TaxID=1314670 RepID=A0A8E2EJT8_9PEZI|nr:putative gentisate 1,2-dioxygenase [Lepidopterella palustris CBS 459.81]
MTTVQERTHAPNGVKLDVDTLETLIKGASEANAVPLWPQMVKYNPPQPNPKCVPYVWDYENIKPYLVRAGELVKEKDAERRVLMLVNPARVEGPYTTDTLYAGLQLVMPNETAPAHRHVAFAMRFVIEGNGGFTAIHGKRITMNRGDVILTPTWNFHDHGKDGSGPMIWLDALDLPSFIHFPVHFVEHYDKSRYPAKDIDTSQSSIVFSWSKMRTQLDEAGGDWVAKEYRKADGSYVSKTLGPSAERISKGRSSPLRRETASCVYHVISGSGFSEIDSKKYEWKTSDTFCIPSWFKYQHFASPCDTVYLYRFDDKPMIEALGFYRWEGMDTETLVS